MIYVPDWESIADGATRVASMTGAEIDTARAALCSAIRDNKIRVQAEVAAGQDYAGLQMRGRQLGIPAKFDATQIDWESSKPFAPWELGRHSDDIDWGPRLIALLEVSTQDIRRIFPSEGHTTTEADETAALRPGFAANKKGGTLPSRDDCVAHMRKTFPDIKRPRVLEMRKTYAPEEWRAHGRRPRRSA
jgi:hypothetical protein